MARLTAFTVTIGIMRDDIRDRLLAAIKFKGLDIVPTSEGAGLKKTYLHNALIGKKQEDGTFKRHGKLECLEAAATYIGLRLEYLRTGEGEMWSSSPQRPPLKPEAVLTALEEVLSFFLPGATPSSIQGLARTFVLVVESPPTGRSETDMQNNIRSEIRGVLRFFGTQSVQENGG